MTRQFLSRSARRVRAAIGWLLFASGWYRRMLIGKAVIVLFHRVDDRFPGNPLTCTSAEFERYIRFFTRYFHVILLSDLLARLSRGEDLSNLASVTFDDGYLDNATIAAPILEKFGARACFFVITDYLESTQVPTWDAKRQIASEWMTWDQVRSLQQAGHEIGSHTRTHTDLGVVQGDAAHAEIQGARKRLQAELGRASNLFSYPYGGRRQMTDDNVDLVKELGLACILSAYGGTVQAGDDPFRLRRTAVTPWYLSPYQFGYELATGQLDNK